MSSANEQDVVIAFRQAFEEELRRSQEEGIDRLPIMASGDDLGTSMRKLVERHENLEHEVALLRTIILKLISDPVDGNDES